MISASPMDKRGEAEDVPVEELDTTKYNINISRQETVQKLLQDKLKDKQETNIENKSGNKIYEHIKVSKQSTA